MKKQISARHKPSTQELLKAYDWYQLVSKTTYSAMWDWDIVTDTVEWSSALFSGYGYTAAEVKNDSNWWTRRVHPDDRERVTTNLQQVIESTENEWTIEYRFLRKDGSYAHVTDYGFVSRDEGGQAVRMMGMMQDMSHQKNAELSQAFLAEASKVLSSSLEYKTTLESIAKLAVPEIADWCSVEFLNKAGNGLDLVAVAHKDPAKIKWAHKLRKELPTDMTAQSGIPQVLRSGKSEYYPVITEEMIKVSVKDPKILKIIKEIGFSSLMIVPIVVEKQTVGVIQFVSTESKKHFSKNDLSMAEELAVRTSLAVHNSKLYERSQKIEQQFQALYESNIIGVTRTTIDGMVLASNDSFLQTIGYPRKDLIKKKINIFEITPPEYKKKLKQSEIKLKKEGVLQPFEKEYVKKDGSQVPVIVGSVMIDSDKQEVLSFVLDITERKKLEQRKDEFIGIASHELRTPLTSVKGYVQILERIIQQMGDDRLATYVKKTNTYIDRLNSLISELLDVSKIQAGKLQLNLTNFAFDDLLKESVEAVQYTIDSHKIILTGETKAILLADKHRLEQVITNLLTNAIKYSPQADKIIVHSAVKDNSLVVSVQDFGIGIAKKEIANLFKRFYRAESVSRSFAGLGIGLFITSEILSRHKGKIWVESKNKKGSTFYFSLPLSPEK